MVSARQASIRIIGFAFVAAALVGCSHTVVRRYDPQESLEVFHKAPARAYVEIGEVSKDAWEEPTADLTAHAKALGADGIYFLPPVETGRMVFHRSIFKHRAIAFKWK